MSLSVEVDEQDSGICERRQSARQIHGGRGFADSTLDRGHADDLRVSVSDRIAFFGFDEFSQSMSDEVSHLPSVESWVYRYDALRHSVIVGICNFKGFMKNRA